MSGMGERPSHGMKEIDIRTGEFKDVKPLKDALDYSKWDTVAVSYPSITANVPSCLKAIESHLMRAPSAHRSASRIMAMAMLTMIPTKMKLPSTFGSSYLILTFVYASLFLAEQHQSSAELM